MSVKKLKDVFLMGLRFHLSLSDAEHHADAFLKDCDALNQKLIAAESRAKNAERERDAAIKELDGVSNAVGNLSDFVDDQIYPLIQYDMYAALRDNIYAITTWEKN